MQAMSTPMILMQAMSTPGILMQAMGTSGILMQAMSTMMSILYLGDGQSMGKFSSSL